MNFEDENIKEIIFNNKNNNNNGNGNKHSNGNEINNGSDSNNNIENVVFNNIGDNNIANFIEDNKNIIVEEVVAIRNKDIIYKDDIVYLKELENQLLSEYPILYQGNKYIQIEVEKVAKKIIELKNIGVAQNDMFKKGIEYNLINNIINDNFMNKIIVPIILDKHRIYTKLKEDEYDNVNNNEANTYFSESLENKNGIIEENQRLQMINLKKILHEYRKAISKIDIKTYLDQEENMTKPHLIKYDENNIGYIRKPKTEALVLRYYDLDTIYWNSYLTYNDFITYTDVFDEMGKITGVNENILIKGNEINVVGFMVLGEISSCDNFLTKKFSKIGIISNIYNSGDIIILEIKNHGLTDHHVIYIEESNSLPSINNTFSKSVKIIDNNKIELNVNIKLIKNGNYGILYALEKLSYDLYGITKETGQIETYLKEKSATNANSNKVYLFDNIIIDNNDYENIIKKIMPSINDILNDKMSCLKNSYTFGNVNDCIKDYSLSIDNLHIQQIIKIKEIFENNLLKMINYKDDKLIKLNFNKNSKKQFRDLTYFLSDKFITDINVEHVYGKYLHLNKPEDCVGLRLKWIESQNDNGEIYYLNYLRNRSNNWIKTESLNRENHSNSESVIFTGMQLGYIKNKINELTTLYNELDKNFQKEKNINNKQQKNKSRILYKFQAYIVTEDDAMDNFKNLKNTLLDDTVIFYNNNIFLWKDGKPKEFKDLEDNTITVVGNELWVWEKNKWYKSDSTAKYENIRHLCELNNLDMSNLTLDSLDCIYRKDYGCKSKIYIRYEELLKKINDNLQNFKKLEEYIETDQYSKNINNKFEYIMRKFFSVKNESIILNLKDEDEDENKDEIKSKNVIVDGLSILLKLINSICNNDLKLEFIYNLINKDGLLIGNDIYSKKYMRSMNICGHYYYFKKINYSDNLNEKDQLLKDMLNEYSDNGETEKNIHVCKHCGEILSSNEYDDTEGFSESGAIKRSREVWEVDVIKKNNTTTDLLEYIKISEINSTTLKEILLKYGLSFEDVDEAIVISTFITKNLCSKTGVTLPNIELINIIIDSMQKIKQIIPYSIYKITQIKALKERGYSDIDIEREDEKKIFIQSYDRYFIIKKNSIIASRFLVSVQTTIPPVIKTSKSSICAFNSFDDVEGIDYITCILDEMKIVLLKDKTKSLELIKTSVEESYNIFKQMIHIKELFKNRKVYDLDLIKKKDNYKFKIDNLANINLIEPTVINDNFEMSLQTSINIDLINKSKNILVNRLLFLAKNIKNNVSSVIEKASLTDAYVGLLESSCCTENADSFLNYYYYIITESEYPVKSNIDESIQLYNYYKYFINIGTAHTLILYDKNKYSGIENRAIVDDEIHTSMSLIRHVFEIYVDTGIYAGTLREYTGNVNNLLDIKSGLTKNEIISKDYSIEEYQALLRNIEKYNIKYYKENNDVKFEKDYLNELKKTSDNLLDKEINNLVKNVAIILNKDKVFIDKYVTLFRNFGVFDNDNNNNNENNTVKKRNLMYKKKLDYIKKFYVTKLKKYLSIIKNDRNKGDNNIDLKFIDGDSAIALEMQSIIFDNNKKLAPFFNNTIRNYFIDLKTNYSNEEINSIYGTDNIYDSKYEKIKVYSDFNFNDASNVMLHILVSELNKFILCKNIKSTKDVYDSDAIYNIDDQSVKCKYICEYIMILFEELDMDYELFDTCKNGAEAIKNSLEHDFIEYKNMSQYKEKEDYFTSLIQSKLSKSTSSITYLDEKIEMDEIMDESIGTDDYKNKMNDIIEKGKKDLFKKLGYAPTEDQLETYKEDYINAMDDDIKYEEEAYDLNSTAKGKNVLDQGADYGGFSDFDFETGEGFDYSEENN